MRTIKDKESISVLVALGKRISMLRKAKKLTQDELAERAHIHPTFISQIERATVAPTVITLTKIASALGISPSELLSDKTVSVPIPRKELLALEISGLLRNRNIKTILLVRSVVKELLKKLPKA